jgi:hypothetical protein
MEEVVGSIPTRSTKLSNGVRYRRLSTSYL